MRKAYSESTAEMQGPKAESVEMPARGDFTREDVPEIEAVTDHKVNTDWADNMSFMEELILINIHETNDPNMEPRVPVCVNGELSHPKFGCHLPRGMDIKVKRKVAEALLRAKPISVKTVKSVDTDGNDTSKIMRSIATAYPFSMVNPKPRDQDWLRRIKAEV